MKFRENKPLESLNWFSTGGAARYFCEPKTPDEFRQSITFSREKELELFFLGEGANVLISDDGFSGLVVHPVNKGISIVRQNEFPRDVLVQAGSGVTMQNLIDYCLTHEITGLEDFSGIPGTVGGSVYINLHYFDRLLSDSFQTGTVINRLSGELQSHDASWFQFGYDQSKLHNSDYYLVDATFNLKKSNPIDVAYARGRRDEIIRHRNRRYPNSHTCGSFFRNFTEEEVELTINGKKMIFVAYYLDKLGLKGELQIGGARVSSKHANMIVTDESATSLDVVQLARKMQQKVQEEFGLLPKPECQLIGFREYPLISE